MFGLSGVVVDVDDRREIIVDAEPPQLGETRSEDRALLVRCEMIEFPGARQWRKAAAFLQPPHQAALLVDEHHRPGGQRSNLRAEVPHLCGRFDIVVVFSRPAGIVEQDHAAQPVAGGELLQPFRNRLAEEAENEEFADGHRTGSRLQGLRGASGRMAEVLGKLDPTHREGAISICDAPHICRRKDALGFSLREVPWGNLVRIRRLAGTKSTKLKACTMGRIQNFGSIDPTSNRSLQAGFRCAISQATKQAVIVMACCFALLTAPRAARGRRRVRPGHGQSLRADGASRR